MNQDRSGTRVAEGDCVKVTRTSRIDVQLPRAASARQRRELTAFARYCIHRLERELGERQAWLVEIAPIDGKYATRIEVHDISGALEANGSGLDGALATWEAICEIEQSLRESCCKTTKPLRRRGVP
jgi:hypothetical protein